MLGKFVTRWNNDAKTSKTANIIKAHVSPENITQKYQMSSVHAACTPVNWPKDSKKYDINTNKKGCMSYYFQVNSQGQKNSEETASLYCFLMFNSSLVISHMRWKLKALQAVSRLLTLQIRPIDKS